MTPVKTDIVQSGSLQEQANTAPLDTPVENGYDKGKKGERQKKRPEVMCTLFFPLSLSLFSSTVAPYRTVKAV